MKPEDLAVPNLSPDDCVKDIWDSAIGEIQPRERPRATAIDRFRREAGVDFKDVRCQAAYIRFFTRQRVWEDYGQDRWVDAWIEEHDVTFGPAPDFTADPPIPEPPEEPPEDWEPREEDPVWEFCTKDTPGAVPVWDLEVKERAR